MTQTILITGSTDGIGLLTAKKLVVDGHHVLLHGRNEAKLAAAAADIGGNVETYCADLSDMAAVKALASEVRARHDTLDVLINNAGVLKTPQPVLDSGQDVRFVVNTYAPYLLTELLLPIIPQNGRVVNLSSAAQAPVNVAAMQGNVPMADMDAYAQSKLAITIWTRAWAKELPDGPVMVAVNPGSLLASKMVKEGFGVAGNDLTIGADILIDAALGARFADKSGAYFDNDSGAFANPHAAALNAAHAAEVMDAIKSFVRANS
ncbi:MAG: SDR family NAD(P)-dependent oxidoreductase [Pseudomonadota bacterium]